MPKTRAGIAELPDVAAFAPKAPPSEDAVARVAASHGFTTRHAERPSVSAPPLDDDEEVYDARVRRGPKVRTCGLNVTVPVRTRNRFWQLRDELDLNSGADVLDYLLGLHAERSAE